MIVLHSIDREYGDVIDKKLSTAEKVVLLAREFRSRLKSLVANWIRVGYCQGNFNSDNCAVGGFTHSTTVHSDSAMCSTRTTSHGRVVGHHFSFLNQPVAAERNFHMFLHGVAAVADVASGLSATARRDSKWLFESDAIANGEDVGCQTWTWCF